MSADWKTYNSSGTHRIVITKELPGIRWKEILTNAGCTLEVCQSKEILPADEILPAIGEQCTGAIGQLTEQWGEEQFATLKAAGGKAYSNYAVGYNNVDVESATNHGIPVGNTPGVLTETTAQMAVALTFAVARRIVEADKFMRNGQYTGWLPTLFTGELLWGKTIGVVGAGRIGSAYARMMAQGHHMNVLYYDIYRNNQLENDINSFGDWLKSRGESPVSCRQMESLDELLAQSDVVSLHPVLNEETHHLIRADRLAQMQSNAVLINVSRGPVIDEEALVAHCKANPEFRVGIDVFEDEPDMKPGFADLDNVTIVPHIASATRWTREGMATLAALNVAGILQGYKVWNKPDIDPFLSENPPQASPSIVNAEALGLPIHE